jgi:hypothetical protein
MGAGLFQISRSQRTSQGLQFDLGGWRTHAERVQEAEARRRQDERIQRAARAPDIEGWMHVMGEECEICGHDRGVPSPSIRNLAGVQIPLNFQPGQTSSFYLIHLMYTMQFRPL